MTDSFVESISKNLELFEVQLFEASLGNLKIKEDPLRYNNFAYSFRELTRHILKRLAPDAEVKNCQWYVEEQEVITRINRMKYAVQGGLTSEFLQDELLVNTPQITKAFKKVIDKLSKYTHIEENSFNIDASIGDIMVENSLKALADFLDTIELYKEDIKRAYIKRVYQSIIEAITSDTINEIDILATNYSIDEIYIEDVYIDSINSSLLLVNIAGIVDVEHQYGSNRDFRNGDGVRMIMSHPFNVELQIDVITPLEIDIEIDDIKVDNSGFYDE
ncbi:hypothetical protein [Sporosarcina psychrophila]|uniref:pPIWI-associating nuclease domain-containing protein n=1 Tax=Sporosarcina TaxID=1569 RepID=UPI0030D3A8B3